MKIVSYLKNELDLTNLKKLAVSELIVEHQDLSRFGLLTTKELNSLSKKCQQEGIHTVLEWDILVNDEELETCTKVINNINLDLIDAIRVQDVGVMEYVKENIPEKKIQLILETGNHNLKAIKGRCDYLQDRVERVVLSIELPQEIIKEYIRELNIPVELLVLGKILLFYSPHKLLSPISNKFTGHASSEETPQKGFPLLENKHGTFMFYTLNHCLLDSIPELQNIGLEFVRVDSLLSHEVTELIQNYSEKLFTKFKQEYPGKIIRGFHNANKSDVLFNKLKNQRTIRIDKNYIGYVIDVARSRHLAIMLTQNSPPIAVNDSIFMKTPEGNDINFKISWIKNIELVNIEQVKDEKIVFVNYIKKACPQSALYFKDT